MSSSKDSMKKRGTSTSLEKSKADRGPGLGMPTSRRAGRRSLYLQVGTDAGRQKAGQTVLAQQLVKRMGW